MQTVMKTAGVRVGRGFTLVEILIVVAIIALLIALLLPALGSVSDAARNTKAESLMQDFSKSCDLFLQEHGQYPGVIPETVLADDPQISGTENALLHLMGGFRVLKPEEVGTNSRTEQDYNAYAFDREIVFSAGWRLKVNFGDIGNGPVIRGKQHDPYFTPADGSLRATRGQFNEPADAPLPDLVDPWGQPIIYLRRARSIGALVGDSATAGQFLREPANPYLFSMSLGTAQNAQDDPGTGFEGWSTLNASGNASCNNAFTLAQWNLISLLGHEAFASGSCNNGDKVYNTARGDYLILSAGPDGVYMARTDGLGSSTNPQDEIRGGSAVIGEYDDIIIMGGGS